MGFISCAAEVRWRFLGGKFYVLGTSGTLLFPTAEGTLRPGAFASMGLGVDNARQPAPQRGRVRALKGRLRGMSE